MGSDENRFKNALDKLDAESASIKAQRKAEPKPRPEQELSRDQKLAKKINAQKIESREKLKSNVIFGVLTFALTLLIAFSMSKEERVTLLEQIIFFILIVGMIAAKLSK